MNVICVKYEYDDITNEECCCFAFQFQDKSYLTCLGTIVMGYNVCI